MNKFVWLLCPVTLFFIVACGDDNPQRQGYRYQSNRWGCGNSGVTRCSGDTLQVCSGDKTWTTVQHCDATDLVCDSNEGVAQCVPEHTRSGCAIGASRCEGNRVQVCTLEEGWVTFQNCGTGYECVTSGGEAVCAPTGSGCSVGAKRCLGDFVQQCNTEGNWTTIELCNDGFACEFSAGVASCVSTSSGCDINGFTPSSSTFMHLIDYTYVDSVDTWSDQHLVVSARSIAPGIGSMSFSASFDTCSICVIGINDFDPKTGEVGQYFFATSGELHINTFTASTGGFADVTFTDLNMEEHTLIGNKLFPTTGGDEWCIDSVNLTGTVQDVPCAHLDLPDTGSFCWDTTQHYVQCSSGYVQATDCAPGFCDDSAGIDQAVCSWE